jgi:dynein heavy chain
MQFFSFFSFSKKTNKQTNTGILQCDPGTIREELQIFRLFCHECQRVFHDRLINNEDKHYFHLILTEMASKYLYLAGFSF